MSSSIKKKIIITVASLLMVSVWLYVYLVKSTKAFEVYLGDAVIGYSPDKVEVKEEYKNILDDLNENLNEEEKVKEEKLSFKRLNKEVDSSTYKEFQENVINTVENTVTLKSLNIKGKSIGYVMSEEGVNNVLKKVGDIYAKEAKIDKDSIESINVKGDIKLKDEKVNLSKLSSEEELANTIVSTKGLLDVDLVVRDKRIIDIEPSVKIERSEDLLVGESKVSEGKKGRKEQNVNVIYRNGKKEDVKVLSEKIIEESSSKVITKGTKNILNSNATVLTSPTRGGAITSAFGERWGKNHNGLDIAGNTGDPVMAALDGKVKNVFYERDGYGNVVILEHEGGIETRYAHMSKTEASIGETVKKGDIVGRIGSTGRSTGPHLHFEVRVNGNPVNPEKYIG
ncbi:MAG: peptidoglycan DD-metalloendopeptidase family protein [Clostridium sp.]|uniref:peptidoglycan DD-metalloendopeptidase family protein n=1 Tax=Clostridium sp. TaxID=1506 RepID=UPI003F2CF520